MYKIKVLTAGKYQNVVTGNRYCFSFRTVKEFCKSLALVEAMYEVTKFTRCGGDMFCFSEIFRGADDVDYDYMFEQYGESEEDF